MHTHRKDNCVKNYFFIFLFLFHVWHSNCAKWKNRSVPLQYNQNRYISQSGSKCTSFWHRILVIFVRMTSNNQNMIKSFEWCHYNTSSNIHNILSLIHFIYDVVIKSIKMSFYLNNVFDSLCIWLYCIYDFVMNIFIVINIFIYLFYYSIYLTSIKVKLHILIKYSF